jgi:hypothetical protein
MKNSQVKIKYRHFVFCLSLIALCLVPIHAQSTNQSYPTPVTANEISGSIKPRDLGDARLTSYFYAFNGSQGDIFINVVTKNLDGDIDVFTADNLRPLTKIVVYADNADGETGRVVYLRQPAKLILRIEGRTPDDNPASFRIKFAGSFAPLAAVAESEEYKAPQVRADEQGDVRVNSVGTIIEVKPKPTPKTIEPAARTESAQIVKETPDEPTVAKKEEPKKPARRTKDQRKDETADRPEAETPERPAADEKKTAEKTDADESSADEPVKVEKPAKREAAPRKTPGRTVAKTEPKPKTAPKKTEPAFDPSTLENVKLIVVFKDGARIERSMSEVLKVGVDKGILTIISKDGSIGRYPILEVAKMTIE